MEVLSARMRILLETAYWYFERLHFAKSFGEEYQTCCLSLDIAQLRLLRWGVASRLLNRDETAGTLHPGTSLLPKQVIPYAQALLGKVIDFLKEAEDKYHVDLAKGGTHKQALLDHASLEDKVASLHHRIHNISMRRLNSGRWGRRVKFALSKKDDFDNLSQGLRSTMDELFSLLGLVLFHELCDVEASEIRIEEALPEFNTVAVKEDELLAQAIAKLDPEVS